MYFLNKIRHMYVFGIMVMFAGRVIFGVGHRVWLKLEFVGNVCSTQ